MDCAKMMDYEKHRKMQQFVKTLNRFYLENRELWEVDTGWDGYEWIEPDDRDRSVIAFRRKDRKGRELVVVCNFCPVLRENYRLGLPKQGWYVPVLNTDDEAFGGYGFAPETVRTEKKPSHGQAQSGLFRVPPMSVCFYRYQRTRTPSSCARRKNWERYARTSSPPSPPSSICDLSFLYV